MSWINVSDRLPENGQEGLCFNGHLKVMTIYNERDWIVIRYITPKDRAQTIYLSGVTHWIPLPNNP